MLILPDRHVARPKILTVNHGLDLASNLHADAFRWNREFRSQRVSHYDIPNQQYQCIDVHGHDGARVWRGYFYDQEDFDAFLFALCTGSLRTERALWDLPVPMWDPDLFDLPFYWFNQTNLTSGSGSQQNWTTDPTWNNAINTEYVVAGGGTGGIGFAGSGVTGASGGGGAGGGCSTGKNQKYSGSIGYEIGGVSGNSWFNGTAISTTGAVSSIGGGTGAAASNSVAGGTTAGSTTGAQSQGAGTVKHAGGTGGAGTTGQAQIDGGGGGGGAAGPTNTGGTGGSGGSGSGGTGGTGDGGSDSGGTGGSGSPTGGGTGGNGTEIGGVGFGGGGGGAGAAGAGSNPGGPGGNYGAAGGGGGGNGGSGTTAAGSGIQGAIFLVWTPQAGQFHQRIFRTLPTGWNW